MENIENEIKEMSFESALKEIINISENFTFDMWIPSIKETIKFKEITASQQKEILTSSMDTSIYSKKFNVALYNIIKTNSSVDISNFTILDKIAICIQAKEKVSSIWNTTLKSDENVKVSVDLSKIIEKIKNNYEHPEFSEVVHDNIKAKIYPSTILEEYDYDQTILKNNKKTEDIKSTEDIQNIISEAFIGELTKTVKGLTISDQFIDLSQMTLKQRIQIVEKLPASLIQNILNIVSDWKKSIDDAITFEENGEKNQIKIDPLFFIG
jgi:uncharacterized protein involved in tolerance to divalent cations